MRHERASETERGCEANPRCGPLICDRLFPRACRSHYSQSLSRAFRPAQRIDISQLPDEDVKKGTAVISDGPDFLFAIESTRQPALYVDDQPLAPMQRGGRKDLWVYSGKLETGRSHAFFYLIEGRRFGGKTDVAALGPDSYDQPGVPHGKLSEEFIHTSKLYDGMKSNYWIYVPAQYDSSKAAALMVWQDGQRRVQR